MSYTLAIADRAYSSWSLRGWLMFACFGLPVTVETGRLYTSELAPLLQRYGAARTVPALRVAEDGREWATWDSLAIAETLAERHPGAGHWPADAAARGLARALVAEMHAGFTALRSACPMNLRRAYVGFEPAPEVVADLHRIEAHWHAARRAATEDGHWLFGGYSLADAFFAPVATRIATYDLPVSAEAADYVGAHLAEPRFLEWRAEALADPVELDRYDLDLPEVPWRGPLA
jgi:glutathione S-transferase